MESEPILRRLRALPQRTPLTVVQFGTAFFEDVSRAEEALGDGLPPVETVVAGKIDGCCLFFACDGSYLEKFGWTLIKSIAAFPSGTVVHIHLFDIGVEQGAELFARIRDLMGDRAYSVTHESTGLSGKNAAIYYHAIRFVRAAQFAAKMSQPLCCIDVDSILSGSADGLFSHLGTFDAQLMAQPGRVEVQNQICAAIMFFAPTENGRALLRRFAAYIATCHRRGLLIWGIDQTALFAVYSEMVSKGVDLRLGPIPSDVFDSSYSAATLVWRGKCDADDPERASFESVMKRYAEPHMKEL